jgi:hypothetical protein
MRKMQKTDTRKTVTLKSPRFFDQFKLFIRYKGLFYSTEKTYCTWVRRFIRFSGYQSMAEINMAQVEPFLSHLANERYCSVNTQRTALNALVFLFREYFNLNIGNLNFVPAKRNAKIPVVLSQQEA